MGDIKKDVFIMDLHCYVANIEEQILRWSITYNTINVQDGLLFYIEGLLYGPGYEKHFHSPVVAALEYMGASTEVIADVVSIFQHSANLCISKAVDMDAGNYFYLEPIGSTSVCISASS